MSSILWYKSFSLCLYLYFGYVADEINIPLKRHKRWGYGLRRWNLCGHHLYNPRFERCCNGKVNKLNQGDRCCGTSAYFYYKYICCGGKKIKRDSSSKYICCGNTVWAQLFFFYNILTLYRYFYIMKYEVSVFYQVWT